MPPPTARRGRVLAINSFVGPANFKVSGQPVLGRSGGGLFAQDRYTVGVCNFADPTDKAGGYAALTVIHALLDEAGLSDVYRAKQRPGRGARRVESIAGGEGRSNVEVICIIRGGGKTAGSSQVIVLERPSQEFLQKLASERAAQQQRRQTSHSLGRSSWPAR